MKRTENLSREDFFKQTNNQLLVLPLRIIALITIVSGLLALVFEVKYFNQFSLQVYLGRLVATTTAFIVFVHTYGKNADKNPVFFVHLLLVSILISFGSVIYFVPETLFINSNIMALVIFTVALFLSWELKHQIILAIYYNLVFATSLLLNKSNVYVLPNLFETVIFVMFISVMAVVASSINYKLRKEAIYKSFEAARIEEKYRNIFNNSLDGIFRMSSDFSISTYNPALVSMLGYTEDEADEAFENVDKIFYTSDEFEKLLYLIRNQGKAKNFKISLKDKKGKEIFTRLNAVALHNENGDLEYIEGTVQDITKQKSLEKQRNEAFNELRNAKIKAEEAAHKAQVANITKTKFLAKINHDLRIPLNNVLGYMELIENMSFSDMEELRELARTARISADTLLDIIGDNIDIAKIESGKIEKREEVFDVEEVLDRSMILIASKAEAKGLKLLRNADEHLPDNLLGDPSRYRQVLLNLLSNAIKFTEKGSVKVEVEYTGRKEKNFYITTKVSDTGKGIPKEELDKIFQPFYRVKGNEKHDGVGLGLSICREIINYMNGELKVKSEPGKGSTFYFTIPLKSSVKISEGEEKTSNILEFKKSKEKVPERIEVNEADSKGKILIVEDNPQNRNIEMKLLSQIGYSVTGVPSGYAALDQVEKEHYDLVLMDIQMEGMDGLETTKRIRAMEKPLGDIPVIAVTAHSSMRDREMCINAGMNDYVEKPISIRYLKMIIDRWLDRQATA